MKILVACEESQRVTIEFRKLGHEAYSCDIEFCSGGNGFVLGLSELINVVLFLGQILKSTSVRTKNKNK